MKFQILGPPELSVDGPRDINLSPQQWGILASLLLAEGRLVPVDSLVDHLWGPEPPPMAVATVRTYVSRINRVLGRGGTRIASRAGAYKLVVDPRDVDLYRFRSLRRQAESLAGSGDLGHAVDLLREADELWRGPLLMGLSGEWVLARRKALDDERYEAAKLRIRYDLDLGRHASILGELWELSERHPLDEDVAGALITALYRLGRQAHALRVARDISERLAEAAIEPGPQLRDIHSRILNGDTSLGVTPAYRSPDRQAQPNTLPPDVPDFVGRAGEADSLAAGCQGNEPVLEVVVGMPGVGKSSLAVHVAHRMSGRYPDAQLFVPFPGDGPGATAEVLHRLLRMLGVPAARIPAETGKRARLWQAEIAHRRAVVVLDDVPDAERARLIVPVAGDSLTIITSRQNVGWPGRRVLNLKPLGDDDSVTLLRRAAGLTACQDLDKAATAAGLCGGLPLAIRVAAGRLREAGLDGLDRLIGELQEVSAGRGDWAESGRQIFSAFEFSYRQLAAEEQRMFRLLGICPCAYFGTDAAAALTGQTKTDVERGIEALCGTSLLERGPEGRFRFHGVTRSYAGARCADEDPESERRRAVGRFIRYYSDTLSAAAAADYTSPRQTASEAGTGQVPFHFAGPGPARAWLEAEWRNILLTARHAAEHEWHRQCADLTHSLAGFLQAAGYWSDAIPAYETALRASRVLGDQSRTARAALDLSGACRRTGDGERARRHAEESLTAYAVLGDQRGQADALDEIGFICWSSGSGRDALALHEEAAELYCEAGDRRGMGKAVMHMANAYGLIGRHAEEMRSLEQAVRLLREAGDRRGEAICLNNMGAVLEDRGLHRGAVAYYEQTIAIFRETHERQNLTLIEHNLGHVKQYKGDLAGALAVYRKVLSEYRANGDLQHQAITMSDIGNVFAGMECYSEALVHHEKSAALAEAIGDKRQLAAALCGMGEACRGSGSYGAAMEKYGEAHRLAAEIEAPYLSGRALYGQAETLLITQGTRAAKIYWRKAYDIFTQLGVREAAAVELRLHGLGATAS